jgi:hypothetical protein
MVRTENNLRHTNVCSINYEEDSEYQNSVLYVLQKNEIKFIQELRILDCQKSKI